MPVSESKRDEIRKIILSLLLARQGAVAVAVLDNDYREAEGERIPWRKLGYSCLIDFLQSMPQYFEIERRNGSHYVRGIASEKSKHVSSLVSRQKTTPKYIPSHARHRANHYIPPMYRHKIRVPAEQLNILVQYVRNYPNGISMQTALLIIQRHMPHVNVSMYDIREQLRELTHQLYIDGEMIRPIESVNVIYRETVNNQPPLTSLESQSYAARPSLEDVYTVPQESDSMYFDEGDFVPAGYIDHHSKRANMSERLEVSFNRGQTPNYCNNNDNDNEDNVVYDADKECPEGNVSALISDKVRSRLEKLARKYPDGIWCSELPEKYLQEHKVSLNYTDLGFSSVREYVSYLPNIFYMTRSDAKQDFMLYSADKRPTNQEIFKNHFQEISKSKPIDIIDSREWHNVNNDNAPFPADISPSMCEKFAPENVMLYDETVDLISVTDLQSKKQFLEIYIAEIFTPSFFWIHLRENRKRFDVFMNELQKFYVYNSRDYAIPKIALKRGLNCACVFSGNWHRGIIKSVKPDFRVTILFYDYGTLKTYAPEDIYYLHRQFSKLPAQAIACGLYNVRPCVGDRWKRSITERFSDRAFDTLLAMTIVSTDPTDNTMMVILTDTSEENDLHINDWLVRENLARRGKLGEAVDVANVMNYVLNNFNQLPTYCYAEESLIAESRSKATSTEELSEVPLISPRQSFGHCDNSQRSLPKPPPGFLSLNQHPGPCNVSTGGFSSNSYLTENAPSAKSSLLSDTAESSTNPFLDSTADEFFKATVRQLYMQIWEENLRLQIKLIEMFRDLMKRSSITEGALYDHFLVQRQFNSVLKSLARNVLLTEDGRQVVASSSRNGTTNNTVPSGASFSSTLSETLANREIASPIPSASSPLMNPFGDHYPFGHQAVTALSVCDSNDFAKRVAAYAAQSVSQVNNWSQTGGGFDPRVQVPSSSSALPTLNNYGNIAELPTRCPLSNTDQRFNENAPTTTSITSNSAATTRIIDHNPSFLDFLRDINNEFVNSLSLQCKSEDPSKETNPFKLSLAGKIQLSENRQSERANGCYDALAASYLADRNTQSHTAKPPEDASVEPKHYNPRGAYENLERGESSRCFAPVGYDANVSDNGTYASRIVYEAGPVMYDTPKRQADKHSGSDCGGDRGSATQRLTFRQSGQCGKRELPSQSANDADASQVERYNDESRLALSSVPLIDVPVVNDEGYVTPTANTLQNSPATIKNVLSNYQQQGISANGPRQVSTGIWNGTEQFHDASKFTNSLPRAWNRDVGKSPRDLNGMLKPGYSFQSDGGNDDGAPTTAYANSLNPSVIKDQDSIPDYRSMPSYGYKTPLNTYFLFCTIESIKGISIIFHMEEDGWMLTHEFVEVFTSFRSCSHLISALEAKYIIATCKEVQRSDYPMQFSQLDSYPLNVARDAENRITAINLISFQVALGLLCKLKIVSREEMESAFKKNEFSENPIMFNMWMLINTYKDFRYNIERYSTNYAT